MSPAEELRTAAARLREMAKDTTSGPWATADCELYPRWILSETATEPGSLYAADVALSYSDDDGLRVSNADWEWMAFASPVLAEPLAAWLESCARHAKKVTDPRNQEAIADPHALAVARAVNASAPAPTREDTP